MMEKWLFSGTFSPNECAFRNYASFLCFQSTLSLLIVLLSHNLQDNRSNLFLNEIQVRYLLMNQERFQRKTDCLALQIQLQFESRISNQDLGEDQGGLATKDHLLFTPFQVCCCFHFFAELISHVIHISTLSSLHFQEENQLSFFVSLFGE